MANNGNTPMVLLGVAAIAAIAYFVVKNKVPATTTQRCN